MLLLTTFAFSLSACSWFFSASERPVNAIVQGVNYVGVSVSDIEEITRFYQESVEVEVITSGKLENSVVMDDLAGRAGVKAITRVVRSNTAQLRLMQFESPGERALASEPVDVQGPGFAHVCYQAKQRTGAYQRFLENGATHIGHQEMVQLNPRNPVFYAYARDPENIMFEIEHVDMSQLELEQEPEYDFRIRHIALATPDYERLVNFYSVLLEQEHPRKLGRFVSLSGEKFDRISGLPGSELKMAFFHMRNMELEIAQYISHPTELPELPRPVDAIGYNMIVFDVSDLSLAKEKLLQAGGTLATERAHMDGAEIFFGRDPDGNLLGFQTLNADSYLSAKNLADYRAR